MNKNAILYLYDTCNLNCGYCSLAKDGSVKDMKQLDFFKNKTNIDKIVDFFDIDKSIDWQITLTGGEPLMMPNFDYFVSNITQHNAKITVFTNLTIDKNSKTFQYILKNPNKFYSIFASLHPEKLDDIEGFLENVKLLKEHSLPIVVKLIMDPKLLHLLNDLNKRCQEMDVSFMPMPLMTKEYPMNYTTLERNTIKQYICTEKQLIHLFGGLDMTCSKCHAGNKVLNIDVRNGNVYPCGSIYSTEHMIGNIYEKEINYYEKTISCLMKEEVCIPDIHYEDNILELLSEDINHLKKNYISMFSEQEICAIIKKYNLKQISNYSLDMRDNNVLDYKSDNQELKKYKAISEERLELINYLHNENEKRLEIIKELQNKIKK